MAKGCMVLLEALSKAPNNTLRFLRFEGVLVTRQFVEMQKSVEVNNALTTNFSYQRDMLTLPTAAYNRLLLQLDYE